MKDSKNDASNVKNYINLAQAMVNTNLLPPSLKSTRNQFLPIMKPIKDH
jgi:hypothetical protein